MGRTDRNATRRAALAMALALALAALPSCRTRREAVAGSALRSDSVARSATSRAVLTFDSLVRDVGFTFDTLSVTVERPPESSGVPEVIRLSVGGGRITDSRRRERSRAVGGHERQSLTKHANLKPPSG